LRLSVSNEFVYFLIHKIKFVSVLSKLPKFNVFLSLKKVVAIKRGNLSLMVTKDYSQTLVNGYDIELGIDHLRMYNKKLKTIVFRSSWCGLFNNYYIMWSKIIRDCSCDFKCPLCLLKRSNFLLSERNFIHPNFNSFDMHPGSVLFFHEARYNGGPDEDSNWFDHDYSTISNLDSNHSVNEVIEETNSNIHLLD